MTAADVVIGGGWYGSEGGPGDGDDDHPHLQGLRRKWHHRPFLNLGWKQHLPERIVSSRVRTQEGQKYPLGIWEHNFVQPPEQ